MKIKLSSHHLITLAVVMVSIMNLPTPALGQEPTLSGEAKAAMDEIAEDRITETISFLASDEMGGRDTPSPELKIASAYVASRFRGSGLEGGGDEGSFFQYAEIATEKYPSNIVARIGNEQLPHFGLLSSDGDELQTQGKVQTYEKGQDYTDQIVTMVAPEFSDRRAEFSFRQELGKVSRAAKLVLLQVPTDHSFVGQAQRKQQPSLIRTRGATMGTVLLVPEVSVDSAISVSIPATVFGNERVRNVIGVLPGSDSSLSEEAVIFSAHLDHIGQTSGSGDTVFNGADDDATGVTAVLSLADAFTALATPPKRTVIFMTFWGEEKGLLGSKHYAKNPTWPLEKVVANINLEMLGRPEGGAHHKCWMTGWNKSDLGKLMQQGAAKVGVEVFEHPRFSAMLYGASDNASFVREGVIAHSFSAGSLHEDYHQLGDHWEKLELGHMTKVIRGIFAGSYPIANGKLTPSSQP